MTTSNEYWYVYLCRDDWGTKAAGYFAFTLWSYRAAADACAFDDLSFWRAIGARS